MKGLVIIGLVLFNLLASAKQPFWYEGVAVLANRQVLTGEFSVDVYHNIILFKGTETISVFPAHRIQTFQYYDAKSNINRKFISFEDSQTAFYSCSLYEVVVRGNVGILRRPKYEIDYQSVNSDKFSYDYYIKHNNQLTMLLHFRTKVYPELLNALQQDLRDYIHKHRLNPNVPADAIRIIIFCNGHEKVNNIVVNF